MAYSRGLSLCLHPRTSPKTSPSPVASLPGQLVVIPALLGLSKRAVKQNESQRGSKVSKMLRTCRREHCGDSIMRKLFADQDIAMLDLGGLGANGIKSEMRTCAS